MKPKTNPDDKISLNKKQVRTILFWLDTANSKYYGGSHRDIVEVFELLARFCNDLRNSKVKWKWKPSHELTEYDLLKRQTAEDIFKDLEAQELIRKDKPSRLWYKELKQKYLQNHNGTTIQEDTVHNGVCGISCSNDEHNQERDSDSSDNKLESRPDVCECGHFREQHFVPYCLGTKECDCNRYKKKEGKK